MRKDKELLVQYFYDMDIKEENPITSFFYEGNFSEFIQSMQIAKDMEIKCKFNKYSENIDEEWLDCACVYNISDIIITLPSKSDLFVIKIFIRMGEEE